MIDAEELERRVRATVKALSDIPRLSAVRSIGDKGQQRVFNFREKPDS